MLLHLTSVELGSFLSLRHLGAGTVFGSIRRLHSGHRFDISDQCIHLLFANQALKRGHNRLESFYPLRAGIKNALADVILVSSNGASIFKLNRLAENSLQVRAAPLRVGT